MAAMQDAMSEAMSAVEEGQDVEKNIQDALACPCLDDLKDGPCGPVFVEAFKCFIRSEHEDKGMDCLDQFKDFQVCLAKNPDHMEKIMLESAATPAAEDAGEAAAASSPAEKPPR